MRAADLARHAAMIAYRDHPLDQLCLKFDELLRRAIPYGVAAWTTHDPATGLSTSCTMSGLPKDPEREAQLYAHEFRDGEPATYLELIGQQRAVAVLSQETDGDLERASRFRELLADYGVTDEMRVILWSGDVAWGSATLYRLDGPFTATDVEAATTIAPHAATGIRLCLLRAAATRPQAVAEPPGIVEVAPGGEVVAMTTPASRWLDAGGIALVTAVNIIAAAIRERSDWAGASSRLVLPDGMMLTLHAASMATDDGRVAVIVDRARPAAVSALLVDAYELTPRQREAVGQLLLGRSMAQIARALQITEHTANDHRKAIYARMGVSSRSELAALLQAEHYSPEAQRGAVPSPYGGFLDVPWGN